MEKTMHETVSSNGGFNLEELTCSNHVLLLFTPDVQNACYLKQKEVLGESAVALADRDVATIEVIGADVAAGDAGTISSDTARQLRQRFCPDVRQFGIILLA